MPVDRARRFSLPGIHDLNKDQDEALALADEVGAVGAPDGDPGAGVEHHSGPAVLQRHRIDFMAEPASYVPGEITYRGRAMRFDRATIFRELPDLEISGERDRLVSGFINGIKRMQCAWD